MFGSAAGPVGTTSAEVEAGWERPKTAEKGRTSALDGVPMALPALSLATKLVHRAEKNVFQVEPVDGDDVGTRLMALVVDARAARQDPESSCGWRHALRRTGARRWKGSRSEMGKSVHQPSGHRTLAGAMAACRSGGKP